MAQLLANSQYPVKTIKGLLPDKRPSNSQVLAVATLLPIGGFLLTLAGITLIGTIIGLVVATPLFVIFSPVLVPSAITIGIAVMGFLTAGALGLAALLSVSWLLNYLRGTGGTMTENLDYVKQRMQDTAGYVGQKTKDVGHGIQSMAQGKNVTNGR
ncbi:PREDICTED: oleosin 18.2 kDa-like [Nelumbo nucifera]|uniref:Oleosin 18.2 kDa-like n=2 Tax=Nelumbo nucifera TaxID=4432 RepID=A0A1U7Z5Q5_NELNU|nr:PREDICTED: oleosin 18.2 kDa-like [Nelumbo nucifera]DAD30842.1 TPA_asm: hypothetical protein HUJ06_009693 [Nelumbo nucifera]